LDAELAYAGAEPEEGEAEDGAEQCHGCRSIGRVARSMLRNKKRWCPSRIRLGAQVGVNAGLSYKHAYTGPCISALSRSSAGATTIDPYDGIPNKLPVIYRTQNLGISVACAGFSLGLLVILQLITTQAGWLIATAVISFVIFAKPLYFERFPSNLSVSLSLIVFGFPVPVP